MVPVKHTAWKTWPARMGWRSGPAISDRGLGVDGDDLVVEVGVPVLEGELVGPGDGVAAGDRSPAREAGGAPGVSTEGDGLPRRQAGPVHGDVQHLSEVEDHGRLDPEPGHAKVLGDRSERHAPGLLEGAVRRGALEAALLPLQHQDAGGDGDERDHHADEQLDEREASLGLGSAGVHRRSSGLTLNPWSTTRRQAPPWGQRTITATRIPSATPFPAASMRAPASSLVETFQ